MNNEQFVRARIAHEQAMSALTRLAECFAQAGLRDKNARILDASQVVLDHEPVLGERQDASESSAPRRGSGWPVMDIEQYKTGEIRLNPNK